MKIAIASDVHLEFGDYFLENTENAEVLILAGDIMIAEFLYDNPTIVYPPRGKTLSHKQIAAITFRNFLKKASEKFSHIIYVAGNHEFYHGKWHDSLNVLRNECANFPNIYFLENNVKEINGYLFVGTTLWTDMNKCDPMTMYAIKNEMKDFKLIRNDHAEYRKLTPEDIVIRHKKSLEFIKTTTANANKPVIVVTHQSPSQLSVSDKYKDDFVCNGAYRSCLEDFILDSKILAWVYGHTHDRHEYYLGDTFMACNPRGYIDVEATASFYTLRYLDLSNMPEKFDEVRWL